MADFACFMGLAGGSSYQRFESEERQKFMPREHIEKLAAAIVGQGTPPVTQEEVMALAGIEPHPSGQIEPEAAVLAIEVTLSRFARTAGVPDELVATLATRVAHAATAIAETISEETRAGRPINSVETRIFAEGLVQGFILRNRGRRQSGSGHQNE